MVGITAFCGVPGSFFTSYLYRSPMNSESPVTLHKHSYRGATSYLVTWKEDGVAREKSFPLEAEAVMEMAEIEKRLQLAAMAGKGLTVNPFGAHTPFINSKDVHFAALKLQPRGLKFRDSIEDYVAAVASLKGTGLSVAEAGKQMAEVATTLKPFDMTASQAVFEWAELKKQIGETPLFEVLRVYLKAKAAEAAAKVSESEVKTEPPPEVK